jgi:hypothetical protein
MKEVGACVHICTHPYLEESARARERLLHTKIMMMINIQKIRIQ